LVVRREGEELARKVTITKTEGQPLGLSIDSAVFDRIRTCDNHCTFCFIYQLPKGMRRSLYVKDDDFRLSFLYGNYTTLTRFTEFDLERVLEEGLSPLYVSIHTTNPELRAEMLRNPRGATSLRWLKELLRAGIEVHAQVVVCPGVNDGRTPGAHLARRDLALPRAGVGGARASRGECLLRRSDHALTHAWRRPVTRSSRSPRRSRRSRARSSGA
jgi:putative radical SAM enzyme (TIGR03279 family)